MASSDPAQARRAVEQARDHIATLMAGDQPGSLALFLSMREEDARHLVAVVVIVAAHALSAVDQLGGNQEEVLRQGLDLATEGLTE